MGAHSVLLGVTGTAWHFTGCRSRGSPTFLLTCRHGRQVRLVEDARSERKSRSRETALSKSDVMILSPSSAP